MYAQERTIRAFDCTLTRATQQRVQRFQLVKPVGGQDALLTCHHAWLLVCTNGLMFPITVPTASELHPEKQNARSHVWTPNSVPPGSALTAVLT